MAPPPAVRWRQLPRRRPPLAALALALLAAASRHAVDGYPQQGLVREEQIREPDAIESLEDEIVVLRLQYHDKANSNSLAGLWRSLCRRISRRLSSVLRLDELQRQLQLERREGPFTRAFRALLPGQHRPAPSPPRRAGDADAAPAAIAAATAAGGVGERPVLAELGGETRDDAVPSMQAAVKEALFVIALSLKFVGTLLVVLLPTAAFAYWFFSQPFGHVDSWPFDGLICALERPALRVLLPAARLCGLSRDQVLRVEPGVPEALGRARRVLVGMLLVNVAASATAAACLGVLVVTLRISGAQG